MICAWRREIDLSSSSSRQSASGATLPPRGVRTCEEALPIIVTSESSTYFQPSLAGPRVVAVPASMDGAFRNEFVECSLGFDTACKVYASDVPSPRTACPSPSRAWSIRSATWFVNSYPQKQALATHT